MRRSEPTTLRDVLDAMVSRLNAIPRSDLLRFARLTEQKASVLQLTRGDLVWAAVCEGDGQRMPKDVTASPALDRIGVRVSSMSPEFRGSFMVLLERGIWRVAVRGPTWRYVLRACVCRTCTVGVRCTPTKKKTE